jgi:uncharacterized protein
MISDEVDPIAGAGFSPEAAAYIAHRGLRNLSSAVFGIARENDLSVPLRSGGRLLADLHRPDAPGRFPVLVSASPYPRKVTEPPAPANLFEAVVPNYFVPRGYAHLIANLRGTGGSSGEFTFFDEGERRDMLDLVEWAAAQPWCDGTVGMIGISYFAMTQLEAAVQAPAALKAIFPICPTADLYESTYHHGLFNSRFVSPFLGGQRVPVGYDDQPWGELWQTVAVEHQARDAFWDSRTVLPFLDGCDVPTYLSCHLTDTPQHLTGTVGAWRELSANPHARLTLTADAYISPPWTELTVEALAWFDHWLKGQDTGILEGSPVRYWLRGAEEWRTVNAWPPTSRHVALALNADGSLDATERPGSRAYLCPGTALEGRPNNQLPTSLSWQTEPLDEPLDSVGEFEVSLRASASALDVGWIVTLLDVAPDGSTESVTAGWLRASMREVDPDRSRTGSPALPCRTPTAVPIGVPVSYRMPLVPNAYRFAAGHRVRLLLTSDDRGTEMPAMHGFRHAPVGTTSLNTIHSSSRLLLPVN